MPGKSIEPEWANTNQLLTGQMALQLFRVVANTSKDRLKTEDDKEMK